MLTAIILIVLLLSIFGIWKLPFLALRKEKPNLGNDEYLSLINEYRKTIAQIIGGMYVLIGLGFTWTELSSTKESLMLSERRYVRESYDAAIQKLGSKQSQIRLGAIYVLTDIVQESDSYSSAVIQLLTSHIRMAAKNRKDYSNEEIQACINAITKNPLLQTDDLKRIVLQDSLTRFDFSNGMFYKSILAKGNFSRSNFSKAKLIQSMLYGANCYKCNMNGADLSGSNLMNAKLRRIILTDAILINVNGQLAKMKEAILINADISGADFTGANFHGANFTNTVMDSTDFSGADLSGSIGLKKQQIQSAVVDDKTILPFQL